MKKTFVLVLLALFCICGYAQIIDPVLLEEMGQRRDNDKIRVFVIMRQQYDQQQLNRRAAQFTTRAERREFVVNELKQFADASQYDLRHTLVELQRGDMVSEPKVLWIANAIYFEANRSAILSLADRSDIMVIGYDEERNWLPDGEESQPADPTREITSNVTQVNANQVWGLGYTGRGVVVAVIDTGVNYNHLDLADHLWDGGPEFPHHGYDVINNDNDPMDDHSHGTHCAGTVCGDGTAGSQTGMAPDATLMCVKCLSSTGRGSDTDVINGMQWAVAHGCDVISMSLGGHGHSGAGKTILRNACVNVLNAGVIASIAAGNEGDELYNYPIPDNVGLPGGCPPPYLDPEQEQNPGGLSCSVCVGAVNSDDQAADFTSHGPRDWSNSDYADYPYTPGSLTEFGLIRPDVCAPGVYIKSTDYGSNTGYSVKSGTSMATPCVAGCMALMLSKNIDATPAELCRILEETAVPLSTGKSNIYGYGRVDVLAAVNAMYSGPLTLDSFTINDGQGNNDGKLNAGESVTLNLSLTNDSEVALDGATMVLTTSSEYVTITNGTASLPHFGAGQSQTINNIFAFTLSNEAPAKRLIQLRGETYVNGELVGVVRIGIMVYGHILRFVEVTVLNDSNGNGSLEAGETANLHVTLCNIGNELASSIVGALSTTYPYLVINSNNKSFGTIGVNEQASADFNVSLTGSAPESYSIDFSLDLVDVYQKHTDVDFELWRKAITLTSNPAEGGILSGGGYYGQGQTCTITATANPGYAFVKWTTLNGSTVSYLSSYTFEIMGEAAYVAHFQTVIDGVVIGDGAGRNSYLPTTVFNQYALSQQIYTADELNLEACDITGVSFFNTSSSYSRDLTIYMVNTSKTDFSSNSDWITVTEDNQVFSGSYTFTGGSWTTIYFDTVFVYDGSSNIALIVDDNSASMYLSSMSCRVSSTESCQALCVYNLFNDYNPYNPTYSGNQYMEKNQVIFGVAHYDYTVTVSANPSDGGTVSGGGGPYYYGYPITLTATPAEGYVFNNWTKNGEVVSCLSTYRMSVSETAEYVANFQQMDGIAIGEASNTNAYLPTYYYYSLTEQIYTADEMGGASCQISSVSFFNTGTSNRTRTMSVYMVSTDKTVFDSISDWIPVTESNLVFSGSVVIPARDWATIYFSTPFNYDGSSNVALIVDDNSNSYNTSTSCRTFSTDGSQALRIYGSDTNYDPYNPMDYSGTLMSMKNQVVFGLPSYDYTITATANPADGGTVSGGGLCYLNQPITLTATPNEGYVFSNWTKDGEVVSYLSTYTLTVTESAEYVANFQQMDGIVIGNAVSASYYLPTYYCNSLSEQIYTANEMGGEACEISSMSFFNTGTSNRTRTMSIYMVSTDKTAFDSISDWIPVTESDLMFSGNVVIPAHDWATIYFSTPFNYDGFSNVALIVDDNSNNYNSYTSCRTFNTEENQAIHIYGYYNIDYDPINPSGNTGTLMSMKNQIVFGLPSYDYTITATANPTNGGTVSGGGLCYLNQPITLTATPNEGYVFSNWTKDGEVVSYLSTYTLTVTESAEYVANFEAVPNSIVIGNPTNTNAYLPTYSYYSLSEQIYTANEMGDTPCQISSVSFFNTGTSNRTRTMSVYMVSTDKTVFDSISDWIPVSESDLVFSGNVTFTVHGWATVYFSTPFDYDGSSNVALIIDDNTNSYNSYTNCRTFVTEGNQAIRISGSGTNYDPTNPSSYTGTLMSMKNQVVFGIPSYDYTIAATANPANSGTVIGGGPCYLNQPVTLTATPNEGYVFNNWTKDGEVVSYLSSYTLTVTESAEYVANFEAVPNSIVIGNPTNTNAYLPTYNYYSLTEQIYTADEMGGVSCQISSVSFFNTGTSNRTRTMNVYMVSTDKTVFDSISDWIPVSERDLVFSGSVIIPARDWATIYFSTPFSYDGSSNVALIVDDNSNSYNTYTSCRTFSTEGSQAIRIYGSGTNYDPINPTGYTGTLMSMKNQVVFGIPSYDYTISVTANPTNGGTVSGGGPCYLNQPITLTATASEGYIFSNWTKDGEVVSYLSHYNLTVTENATYVANFEMEPDGIVIGDGTYANSYLPTYYYYSLSEQIYTAEEMNSGACEISSVSFFNANSYNYGVTRNMSVYMVNTDKTSFEGTSDWIPVTENDLVFSGNVTFTTNGWVTVYFSTPFNYDGSSNVALVVDDNSNNYNVYTSCRTFGTEESQAIRIYGSGTNYDPTNPSEYTGTLMPEKNQVIFGIPSYDYMVTVAVGPDGGGTVSGGGPCYLNRPITLTATPNEGYVFSKWTKNGEVVSYLSSYILSVTESAEYVAHFQEVISGFVIGNATYANAYLPIYYYNSLSEQIYTAAEMGGSATNISSVSFFNTGTYGVTRNMSVYMVNTDKTSFESTTDWIPVTENDLVFSGSVAMTARGWATVYFSTPFVYDGVSNVALVVDDNSNSYNAYTSCRTFSTEENQAIRIYGYNTDYDPTNPSGYTGTLVSMKNQVIFRWPSTVTATANPTGGGTVSGCGNYAYGTTCTWTATPNAGYYFLNWTENGSVVSYDAAYSFTVEGDRNLVANFIEGESNCTIVFDLYSSWGSGWYGNYLVVDYGNGNTEQLTLSSGSSISYSREVATGSTIALSWIAGSYTYQCSFDVKFENGVPIYHGSSLSSSFQQELNINCAVATAPHVITAVADPEEGGTIEGAGTYDGGTAITLTATPNDGYSFCFWSENGQQVSTNASYSFIVSSDRDLVARFSLPLTVSATTNMTSGGAVTGAGVFNYGNTCMLTATPNEGYLFLNWSKNGVVVSCNATYSFTVTEDTDLEAVFMRLEGTLIGQGEATNSYLPSYSYFCYTLSQQIYTPNEIGEAGNITTISYFNAGVTQTRSYDIYMVHTDKSTFANNTDWITVTEADRVYSGSVTITQGYWTTIILDTPFAYDGTSNLAIIVDDNTGTWLSSMACRVFNANGSQAIHIYSDNTNYDPYDPSGYSGTRYSVKNQIILGMETEIEQTIALSQGWNWVSANVEITLDDLEDALVAAYPNASTNALIIKSNGNGQTAWNPTAQRWIGGLNAMDLTQMYMVKVATAGEITLQGLPINPAEHPVTIANGNNWIAFPLSESMTVTDAFAGFPANGDVIKSNSGGQATWNSTANRWIGGLTTLEPGKGYIYNSKTSGNKVFTFPLSTK